MSNNATREMNDSVQSGKSAIASAGEAARSAGEEVSHKVSDVVGKVKDMGSKAAGFVRDQYDHLSEGAHDAYDKSRDKVRHWEQSAEGFVQDRPVQALLIAAGVGALLALLWRRH